ncbi:nitroreductase [Steroidobacter sp.]|uniref:nitroreductase n=1 Tax=Steroidobacter sp. TaxID=1978227 RepID=UPI001A580836|nr:nitroreductase [Steroidobacter sp.]
MTVTAAVDSRISCRAFLDKPVPKETLLAILESARRAPSGGNLQPWLVHVLTGQPLTEFLAAIRDKASQLPMGEGTEYNVYPPELQDPYRARRFKCGEDMYATIGVTRDNRPARLQQFARNFQLFGAPVGLFFCIDRHMGQAQWADLGMFMQTVMLLAREHGLHSCAQEAWSMWPKTVAEFLRLPAATMLFSGMALGYMDESAPINSLRTERAPLEEFVTLHGC